ncbi:MAG: PaaX family transcriptional regulator C-terminal domain-containing protein [Acidimicrobiia bacterium]
MIDVPEAVLERPLTARSIVLSLLLGRRSTSATVSELIRWCGLFEIPEGTVRVALSRAVASSELVAAGGSYAIAGRLRERQEEQEAALAFEPGSDRPWDGTWRLALVEGGRRNAADRGAFRHAAARLHLVELREGVWGRPDNLTRSPSPSAERIVSTQASWWIGAVPPGDQRRFAARQYSTVALRDRGASLHRRLVTLTADLQPAHLAEAFTIGAAVAQFLRRDPRLPDELLPARWPGDDLRDAYASYRRAFGRAVSAWLAADAADAAEGEDVRRAGVVTR